MLAALAFCEMMSQHPEAPFQGLSGVVGGGGQQQFATQTLRVHLLGVDFWFAKKRLLELAVVKLDAHRTARSPIVGWEKALVPPFLLITFPLKEIHGKCWRNADTQLDIGRGCRRGPLLELPNPPF